MPCRERQYQFAVYIVSNFRRTTFYTGFTNNLVSRVIQHKYGIGSKFTSKYKLTELVYYEIYQYAEQAIKREKEIKKWRKEKKLKLIKTINPTMKDLSQELFKDYDINNKEIKEYAAEFKSVLKISPPTRSRSRNDKIK